MNKIINGFWSGSRLSSIEQLSIRSFMNNGHEYHLWITEPVANVPEGVICHNTNEIVPDGIWAELSTRIHFSDYFRPHVIYKMGGWYIDTDIICLKKFNFPEPYVFVSEEQFGPKRDPKTPTRQPLDTPQKDINGCLFKSPAGAPYLEYILDEILKKNLRNIPPILQNEEQGIGFGLFRKAVPKFGLLPYVKAPIVFDALSVEEYPHFVSGGVQWNISEKSYAMHLRKTCWSNEYEQYPLKVDGRYPEDSLFEQLKRKHGVQ